MTRYTQSNRHKINVYVYKDTNQVFAFDYIFQFAIFAELFAASYSTYTYTLHVYRQIGKIFDIRNTDTTAP